MDNYNENHQTMGRTRKWGHVYRGITLCLVTLLIVMSIQLPARTSLSAQAAGTNSPAFMIESDVIPTGKAGDMMSFQLKVKNIGNEVASDTVMNFTFPEATPLENTTLVTSKVITSIAVGGIATLSLSYRVKSSAQIGVYPVNVSYAFKNLAGDALQATEVFFVRIIEGKETLSIDLTNVRTSPYIVTSGNKFDISFDIANNSSQIINNVQVTLDGLSPTGLTSMDTGVKSTGVIASAQRKPILFSLNASDKLEPGGYPVTIKFQYTELNGELKEQTRQLYIQVTKDFYTTVKLSELKYPTKSIATGKPFEISFVLENTTRRYLENISVTVDGGDKIIPISSGIQRLQSLNDGEKKSYSFILQPLEKIEVRPYQIAIEVKYLKRGSSTELETYRETVTIDVLKSSDIQAVAASIPVAINENQEFDFAVDLVNTGLGTAKNVKATLELTRGLLAVSSGQANVPSLASQATTRVSFKLRSTQVTEEGVVPIILKLTADSMTEAVTINYGVFIQKNSKTKSVPRVILDKYTLNATTVKPGDTFEISLRLVNTNISKAVSNLKATIVYDEVSEKLGSTGGVFAPVDASNTFYISKLAALEGTTKNLKYRVMPNAESKNYTVTLNMEYEDEEGNIITAKESMTIPVELKGSYYMTDVYIPPNLSVYGEHPLSVKFFNTGKIPLNYFQVKVEGDFKIDAAPYFAVNLAPSTDDSYEFIVIPEKTGELSGTITVSYKELNGEIRETVTPFTIQVVEEVIIDETMIEQETNISEKKLLTWTNALLFVLIASAVAAIFIIRAKRARRASFDE